MTDCRGPGMESALDAGMVWRLDELSEGGFVLLALGRRVGWEGGYIHYGEDLVL